MVFLIIIASDDQLDRRIDQEGAEQEEHPREAGDQGRADQNENATENQSNGDADGQHILLNLLGHREVRHDNDEHE